MEIKNVSPLGALDVPALGRVIEFGEVVDVPDEIAVSLLQQVDNFEPAKGDDKKGARR